MRLRLPATSFSKSRCVLVVFLGCAASPAACSNGSSSTTPAPAPIAPAPTAIATPTAASRPSQPLPTPTATPGSTRSCPIRAEVCEAARIIQSALEANNVEPLMSATSFAEYDCPAVRAQGLGGPYPLCDDTPGERRAGFREANDVQGFVIDRSKIESHWMMMIDSSTSGFDWRVRSIACRVPAPGDDCSAALVVLGKQDADGGIVAQQSAALFEISFAQGRTFQITAFTAAFVLGDAPILLHGGATPANPGHSSIFGFGPFHRVRVQ